MRDAFIVLAWFKGGGPNQKSASSPKRIVGMMTSFFLWEFPRPPSGRLLGVDLLVAVLKACSVSERLNLDCVYRPAWEQWATLC